MKKCIWYTVIGIAAAIIILIVFPPSCDRTPDGPEHDAEYYKGRIELIEQWHRTEKAALVDSVISYKRKIRVYDSLIEASERDQRQREAIYVREKKALQNASNEELVTLLRSYIPPETDTGNFIVSLRSGEVLEVDMRLYDADFYKQENKVLNYQITKLKARGVEKDNLIKTLQSRIDHDSVYYNRVSRELTSALNDYEKQIKVNERLERRNRSLSVQRWMFAGGFAILLGWTLLSP